MDGINVKNNEIYICQNPNSYASDVFTGEYVKLSYKSDTIGEAYSPLKLGYDSNYPYISVPEVTAETSSAIPDRVYGLPTGNCVVQVGGRINSWDATGAFHTIHSWRSTALNYYGGCRVIRYR